MDLSTSLRLKIVYGACVVFALVPLLGFAFGFPRVFFDRGSEAALGHFWEVWPCFAASIFLAWWSIPSIVSLAGGVEVVDDDTRAQIARERARPHNPIETLLGSSLLRWVSTKSLESGLRVASIRRRYGHFAIGVFLSSLFVMLFAVERINADFASEPRSVECHFVRAFKQPSGLRQARVGCALPDGTSAEGIATVTDRPPMTFAARARRGALGVWLLDVESIPPRERP
jgi:hypothetical protein